MLDSIFKKRITKTPNKTFIRYKNQKICFLTFYSMVNNYCDTLKTKKNEYVGLQINNKLKLLVAIIALNRKQSIPVIYPNNLNVKNFINAVNTKTLIRDFKISKAKNCSNQIYDPNINNTQVVLFTSGSSGLPKACEVTYKNLYESARMWNEIIDFQENDIYLNHMPLTHVSGLCIFFRALYYNFEMILDDFNIRNYIKYSEKINLVSMVPTMMDKILNSGKNINFHKMKSVIIGGDNINQILIKKIQENKIPAYISYGLTESCSGIAGLWVNEYKDTLVYNAHPKVKANLKNKLLEISSPTIIKKYYNSKKLFKNYFTTSDHVKIVNKNQFMFINRSDDIIISGGENISINHVKQVFLKFKKVNSCSIQIINDQYWGQVMHAEITSNKKIDLIKFKRELKAYLPNFMIPKKISLK